MLHAAIFQAQLLFYKWALFLYEINILQQLAILGLGLLLHVSDLVHLSVLYSKMPPQLCDVSGAGFVF